MGLFFDSQKGYGKRKAETDKHADRKRKAEKLNSVGKGHKEKQAYQELLESCEGNKGEAHKLLKQAGVDIDALKRRNQ